MAESTLSLTFEDLGRSTAFYLGWRRFATEAEGLSAAQAANVEAANRAGYRDFLGSHDWAFLAPRSTMTLWKSSAGTVSAVGTAVTATAAKFFPTMIGHSIVIATIGTFTITAYTSSTVVTVSASATCSSKAFTITADGVYRMPDDFGGIASERIFFGANTSDARTITLVQEPMVVEAWQATTAVTRPSIGAFRPLSNSAGTGQRFDFVVAAIPDADYPVSIQYNVHPNALTAGLYPYGGMKHAETIRLACLAAAEGMFNENQTTQRAAYARALERSKALDLRQSRAERLGISQDREYGRSRNSDRYDRCVGATVEGVQY